MSSLPAEMLVSVLREKRRITLESRPVPRPQPDEVLIRVASVGVCGSDVHFWHDGHLGDWVLTEPLVLGHESSGTIVAVGSDVTPSRIGDRVSIEPQRPNTTSAETLSGRYNLDPGMRFFATPGCDGAFAEYVTIQSHFAWAVPKSISDDAAALMEPLSVGIAAMRKAGITAGSRVLISGAGPIGIVATQTARAYGASQIIVSDINTARRDQAASFGATDTIDPQKVDIATLDFRVDAYIDASGAASAIQAGIRAVRPGGKVILVGMGQADMQLPVSVIQNHELLVTGVFRYANTWPTAIGLVERGLVDLDGLVTGHFPLDQVDAALASTATAGVLKSIVNPGRRA